MDLVEKSQHIFLDISSSDSAEWSSQVGNEMLTIGFGENFLPKSSWLLEVGIWMGIWISTNSTCELSWGPSKSSVFNWSIEAVWLIVWCASTITIDSGSTISEVIVYSSSIWAVDWNLLIVLSESISMSIWI